MPRSARMFGAFQSRQGLARIRGQRRTKRFSRTIGLRNVLARAGGAVLEPSFQLSPMAAIADVRYRREPASRAALVGADTMPTSRASHLRENK